MSSNSTKYTFRSKQKPANQNKEALAVNVDAKNNHINSNVSEEALQRRKLRFQAQPQTKDYGFVSRGETRLKESESERRKYFDTIVLSFFKLCDEATRIEVRERIDVDSIHSSDGDMTMDGVLTSLRKLREAILGTKPSSFSKKVLLFSVRVAVPLGHYQTYVQQRELEGTSASHPRVPRRYSHSTTSPKLDRKRLSSVVEFVQGGRGQPAGQDHEIRPPESFAAHGECRQCFLL